MTTDQPGSDPRLTTWLAAVDIFWRRSQIPRKDRARLRIQVERDLSQALVEGVPVEELTASDPQTFAADTATAHGVTVHGLRPDHPLNTRSVVVVALLGAAVGAALAWLILYPVAFSVMDPLSLSYAQEGLVTYALHGVSALICATLAALAVWWRFRFARGIRRTALLTGLFLLLAGALSVLPTIAIATALSYSTATSVVALEIAVVTCFCALGAAAARAVGQHRRITAP